MNALDILKQWLSDEEKKTLALKGKWGVGKTYAWKRFIAEQQHVAHVAVSYVSLFGVASVAEIWSQILTNAVPKNLAAFKGLGKVARPILGIL